MEDKDKPKVYRTDSVDALNELLTKQHKLEDATGVKQLENRLTEQLPVLHEGHDMLEGAREELREWVEGLQESDQELVEPSTFDNALDEIDAMEQIPTEEYVEKLEAEVERLQKKEDEARENGNQKMAQKIGANIEVMQKLISVLSPTAEEDDSD